MDFINYVTEQKLILIPALYAVGCILKDTEMIKDKYIPVVLLILGVIGSIAIGEFEAREVIQGVLVAGATVYTNQVVKQLEEAE